MATQWGVAVSASYPKQAAAGACRYRRLVPHWGRQGLVSAHTRGGGGTEGLLEQEEGRLRPVGAPKVGYTKQKRCARGGWGVRVCVHACCCDVCVVYVLRTRQVHPQQVT